MQQIIYFIVFIFLKISFKIVLQCFYALEHDQTISGRLGVLDMEHTLLNSEKCLLGIHLTINAWMFPLPCKQE